jgi:deazaflavin-dependent oxidoreductase (nitroreductase family)
MPLPRWLARFNRVATNRAGRPFARIAPGFAVVEHVGRVSGRSYETPVAAFIEGDRVVIPLTYGSGSQWVQNVLAAGGCVIIRRGRRTTAGQPRVLEDAERSVAPALVRVPLAVLGVREFVELRVGGATGSSR